MSDGQFGLSPAPSSSGPNLSYFTLTVPAGHKTGAAVIVSNLADTAVKLELGRSMGLTAANGGSIYSPLANACKGAGCWVVGLPSVLTLPARAVERLDFTVNVPAGTSAGQYLSGISAQLDTGPTTVQLRSRGHASARAVVREQVTVGVAVTVGELSALRTSFAFAGVRAVLVGPMARLNIRLDNTGQTFARATGTASCTAAGRLHSYPVAVNTILPHDNALIAVNAPGLPTGTTLPCRISLSYGNHQTASWSGRIAIPGAPGTRIIHTANGAYTVVPASGVPPWAVALIVLGALIVAGLCGILVRLRPSRRKRLAPPGRARRRYRAADM